MDPRFDSAVVAAEPFSFDHGRAFRVGTDIFRAFRDRTARRRAERVDRLTGPIVKVQK